MKDIKLYDLLMFAVDSDIDLDVVIEEYDEDGEMVYASKYEGGYFDILNQLFGRPKKHRKDIVRLISVKKKKLEIIACTKYKEV